MPTKNSINSSDPIEITKGGTEKASVTAYAILCAGATATGALQSIASVGTDGQVLTSNGAAALPTFQTDTNSTDITPTVTASSPTTDGECFYDTATDTYVGYDGSEVTFTTT